MNGLLAIIVIAAAILQLNRSETTSYKHVVTVHNSSKNSTTCTPHPYNINSRDSSNTLQNSTDVRFCQDEITIAGLWTIRSLAHIKLSGPVTLKCLNDSGIAFKDVSNLTISKVQLVNCGVEYPHSASQRGYLASVFIINSFNLNISKVDVLNSNGAGIFIKNPTGEAEISNSTFKHNITTNNATKSIGVHLEFKNQMEMNSRAQKRTTFKFFACHFENTKRTKGKCSSCRFIDAKQGGGLRLVLGKRATNNVINISYCVFKNLSASNIGGMDISIRNNAIGNVIYIHNATFVNNTCYRCGGGAIRVNIIHNNSLLQPKSNNITIVNCSFVKNMASYGGAVFLNVSKKPNTLFTNNSIKFHGCNLTSNGARYGSAVNAIGSPKDCALLLETMFTNSRFMGNFIRQFRFNTTTIFGQGTVSLKHFSAKFEGKTVFYRNIGSPLYQSMSLVEYGINSHTEFLQNKGLNGGAITMIGSSSGLHARRGSVLNFTENESYFKGGAIYFQSVDGQEYLNDKTCFIQFLNSTDKEDKPKYIFKGNIAGTQFNKNDSLGKSIYASTLVPCNKQCKHYHGSGEYKAGKESSFDCVGSFKYFEDREFEVATSAWMIRLDENAPLPLLVIPGKEISLPVYTRDEFNQTLLTVYKAILWDNNSTNTTASVDPSYRYTHHSNTVLKGEPSDKEMALSLTTEHDREIRVVVRVKLLPCPPGYILHQQRCKCSAELPVRQHYYQGISRCNTTSFQAMLWRGYWIGYQNASSYESLISSICPYTFCNDSNKGSEYPLPISFNAMELDYLICGENRTGMLCGKCRGNMSAFYHSNTYRCDSSRLCNLGWLFYSLSELLPVTFIFLTIIAFDIQLTSGSVNGLILYYQLTLSMSVTAKGFIKFPKIVSHLYYGHVFLANMFDLKNFFYIEELSFCLWKGATVLDVIAFKYVTVVYSLFLVILTVLIMRTCGHRCSCTKLRRVRKQRRQITNSVIHGISGFFVLCYSQCTTISLMLLRPVSYSDPHNVTDNQSYVLYDGSMTYFGMRHLRYVLPALFFIFTLVSVPPLTLLTYPLCYRVFHLLKIEETKLSWLLCKVVPLEKLKPFFDSFQSSFKDKHRYTSGLYFVYRLITVCLAVFTMHNSDLFYILLEIQLLAMIFIHAYFQPYRKRRHNRQDLFIFVNLAIINTLTIFNFERTDQKSVYIASSFQTLLLNLPTLYIAFKIGWFVFTVLTAYRKKKFNQTYVVQDLELLTETQRETDHEEFVNSNSYSKLNKDSLSPHL